MEMGENDTDAVVRECHEELGLQLDDQHQFNYLGKIRDRTTGGGTDVVVACHLYEHLTPAVGVGILASSLQVSEVAGCGWTPLTALTSDRFLETLSWGADDDFEKEQERLASGASGASGASEASGAGGRASGASEASGKEKDVPRHPEWNGFPSVRLPCLPNNFVVSDVSSISEEKKCRENFILWGLTLSMINDLLLTTELRSSPIDNNAVERAQQQQQERNMAEKGDGGKFSRI